jgi:hypothetical protein
MIIFHSDLIQKTHDIYFETTETKKINTIGEEKLMQKITKNVISFEIHEF